MPHSVSGLRPAVKIIGTWSRAASASALMPLAVPTLTWNITICGRPVIR